MRLIAAAAAAAAVLVLALVHLDRYPRLFFDEGAYLQVAKNIALHRTYAESSDDGPRYYGGPVGIGPTVHLPLALAFALLDPSIAHGRAVIVLYALACIGLFFALARLLGGTRLAWIATALLLFTPAVAFVALGRQVMGEVPGLAFVLAGLLLWFRRWERHSTGSLVAVGLLLGLGAVSKNQFALVLDVSLAACALANAIYYRLVPHRSFLVPLALTVACHAGWSALFFALVPPQGRADIVACGPAMAAVTTLLPPSAARLAAALGALVRPSVYFGLLLPAIVFAVHRARARTPLEQQWSIVLVIVLVNFAWFAFLTLGWMRYAFLGLALAALPIARLLDVIAMDLLSSHAKRGPVTWLRGVVLFWVAVAVALSAVRLVWEIATAAPPAAVAMAAFVDANVPAGAVIETWEPEMGFLSDHRFHYPPTRLLTDAITHIHFGAPPPFERYDPLRDAPPTYLLAGEFSVYVQGYRFDQVERDYRVVARAGAYTLYELVAPGGGTESNHR